MCQWIKAEIEKRVLANNKTTNNQAGRQAIKQSKTRTNKMDIMDIQAVESKLSDVTVTPIPRSQVQNFYNYQQQREQREQQPQIQISAIHHTPRDRHHSDRTSSSSSRDLYTSKRDRDYHQQLSNVAAGADDLQVGFILQCHTHNPFIEKHPGKGDNTLAAWHHIVVY